MYKGERFNGVSHLLGVCAALIGSVALIVPAVQSGDVWKILGFSVYCSSLFALYLFSTLYHSTRGPHKALYRQLDHLAIYLLIAGTYTPFLVVTLRDAGGWWMFALIWSLAAVGMILELIPKAGRRAWSIAVYLLMGWLAIFLIKPLGSALPAGGFNLLLAGGVAYTAGIVFYVFDKKVTHFHGVWHLFVLAGSVCHFFTIYYYVA
ncbi:hemolysin III family protein [uncultured Zhongshania sp.]|uniref:PAQR family membrane homeostasis protein TrhA n=1 Tax=uncultured Zhongshania sp. TaxID=1642288 RepID=UPI0025F63F63|nr:hemolysin III family protein [uncultured Zhongshania sp.]